MTRRLGKVPLQALTPLQIEKFYAELLRDGARLGKPLSAKTVRNSHVVLRKALADAERLGLVYRNAAASARPPTAARKEFATWSSDDLRDFFAGIRDDRIFPALLVLATTGMRRGEVLGLRWSDVDLDAGQLAIVQTLTTINGVPTFGATKSSGSRRVVYIDPQTVSVLREHRKRQREEQLIAGPAWTATPDLVFRDEAGVRLQPDLFTTEVQRTRRRVGADADPPPRPAAHLRHARPQGRRPPEGRQRTPRPRHRRHHARPVLPRDAGDRSRGRRRRRRPHLRVAMAVERVPRIRLRTVSDAAALVVRGDELDPTLLAEDASRFHERFPDWDRFGISAFEADSDAEIDVVCQTRLVRFPTVVVFEREALERAGIDVVPTFRRPHVTLCHEALDQLVERLVHCEHRVLINPYHVTDSEE